VVDDVPPGREVWHKAWAQEPCGFVAQKGDRSCVVRGGGVRKGRRYEEDKKVPEGDGEVVRAVPPYGGPGESVEEVQTECEARDSRPHIQQEVSPVQEEGKAGSTVRM